MKKLILSILLYLGYILGVFLVAIGYYFLSQNELSIAKSLIGKQQLYNIKLVTNENLKVNWVKIKEKNGTLYLITPEKEIPLFFVEKINNMNINSEISQKLSQYSITGIILVVMGGFIFLISFLFRDYV